jgi:hypothetical protein
VEPIRILVTGWRDWPEEDKYLIWETLNEFVARGEAGTSYVLVHGQCPYGGVDLYAEQWAIARGFRFEAHPAKWGQFGKAAGAMRNTEMVNLGADVCFAFPGPNSRGTVDCAKKARAAGIPTLEIPWSGALW